MTSKQRRVTFARLVLELRRRAASEGAALRPDSLNDTLRKLGDLAADLSAPEAPAVRRILGALINAHGELEHDGRALDQLTPETVLRFDAVLAALMDGGITDNELRAILRQALIRPVS